MIEDLKDRDMSKLYKKQLAALPPDFNKKVAEQIKSRSEFAESLGFNKNAVLEEDREIYMLNGQIAKLDKELKNPALTDAEKARIKADKDDLKERISRHKEKIGQIKNTRSANYAVREDPRIRNNLTGETRMSPLERLYKRGYVSSAEEKAAAKINIGIHEDNIKELETKVNELKPDIKELEKKIKAGVRDTTGAVIPGADPLSPKERSDLNEWNVEKADLEAKIRDTKLLISNLKSLV